MTSDDLLNSMRFLIAVSFVAAAIGAQVADDPVRGRLCLRDTGELAVVEMCRQVEGYEIEVEAAESDRVWIWYSRDGNVLSLGALEAGASRVRLPEEPLPMTLELDGSSDRDWPQRTTIQIGPRGRPANWTIELSSISVPMLREIRPPPGTWSVRFKADRHVPAAFPAERLVDEPVDLGLIELKPLPQIRGTIIDREGELLSEVMLIAEDGSPLATSDFNGEVLFEAPCGEEPESCRLPALFRLEYPGTAALWFRTHYRDRDLDLDVVRMAPGGALDLRVKREGVRGPIFVDVIDDPKPVPPLPYYPTIMTARLHDREDSVLIENLPEGLLRLAIRGLDAGQYYSEYFVAEAEKTIELEVTLKPYVVAFDVVHGEKPAEGVRIQVQQKETPQHVSQTEPTNAHGRASLALWQPGKHSAILVDPSRRGGLQFDSATVGDSLRIEVGEGKVTGRVVDSGTEEPIAGAAVLAESDFYKGNTASGAITDETGTYEIEGLMPTFHRVGAIAEGYLPGGRRARVGTGETPVETIELGKGVTYTITATWEDGTPIVGAAFFWLRQRTLPQPEGYTDENGQFRLVTFVPPRPAQFWIVPVEGSFAPGELYLEREIDVEVPPPSERVVLDFEDANGDPANYAHVFFTINGRHLHPQLPEALELVQRTKFHSGPAPRLVLEGLAPGSYGFMAVRAMSESEMSGYRRFGKPTTVHVGPGEQTGTVEVRVPVLRCRGEICVDY
ncbi:MAG: carboxypeptidase-like regulatory domain-containing protein [Acidobacteria bacterium]|nr:carboxypeptidase-like regulatory domain-containing protein [Acidobacteriota bacterium]